MASEPDWTPHINWLEPVDEREAARHLSTLLHILKFQEDQFRSSVELIDHVQTLVSAMQAADATAGGLRDRARIANWTAIAANYAAIIVANFRDTIFAIRRAAGQCPSRVELIDTKTLEDMPTRFSEAFPNYTQVRDGFAHFTDKMFTPAKIEANRAPDAPFLNGTMIGRSLHFTVDGKPVSLAVTIESLDKLTALRRGLYEAFRRVSVR